MGSQDAVRAGFQNYANFASRAMRSEYWYWVLFVALVSIAASILDSVIFGGMDSRPGIINSIAGLAMLVPNIAVSVKRLHDIDKSGWFLLFVLIPVLWWIYLIYLYVKPSTTGANRFGPPPSRATAIATV